MSTLAVIVYDDQFKAEEVRPSLMKMQKVRGQIEVAERISSHGMTSTHLGEIRQCIDD